MAEEKHHADYTNFEANSKAESLEQLVEFYKALVEDETNWVCNLANASSLVWHAYHSLKIPVNWAGFYVVNSKVKDELILGPFQGKVACQKIKIGRGVCGTAAAELKTQVVPNVDEFPGHIACDGETKSEIVVPIHVNGQIVGVLDIDSLELGSFNEVDLKFLEMLCAEIAKSCEF